MMPSTSKKKRQKSNYYEAMIIIKDMFTRFIF